jgi:pseudaminic acid cytidylyltransferase
VNVAIIPARGGSKRIPRKNIREFCGKPMIAWSIEAALASNCFDQVVVSTDDEEIAEVARRYGAEVPFLRPPHLADDYAGTIPVIRHAVEALHEQGRSFDLVCCIYATAPLISVDDLRNGLQRLVDTSADYVFPVSSFPSPIQRAYRITEEGVLQMFHPENFSVRSQDLEPAFHDAGQFYWGKSTTWRQGLPIQTGNARPIILPRHRVQDLDTPEDWQRAELLFRLITRA